MPELLWGRLGGTGSGASFQLGPGTDKARAFLPAISMWRLSVEQQLKQTSASLPPIPLPLG